MALKSWPQRGQMFIAKVAASAFFSSGGAQHVASRIDISLRWSEEVPLHYRFDKHSAVCIQAVYELRKLSPNTGEEA